MTYDHNQILELDKSFRRNLINDLTGLKSVNLVASCDSQGRENVAIFNSVVHLGANPPCVGFIMRPLLVTRNTYDNIISTGFYSINIVHSAMLQSAHHTSAKYPPEISEFDMTNLDSLYLHDFPAPFVDQSLIKIGLSFQEELPIAINNTRLIVGKIEQIVVEDEFLEDDGHIDHEKLGSTVVAGLDTYYSGKKIKRMDYARPKLAKK